MKWTNFLNNFGGLPLISTKLLYPGASGIPALGVQISRWKKTGRLAQLRKGLYFINPPYRSTPVYEPYIAAELIRPSYISLEKALEMHNLIPEAVFTFTCVSTKRPAHYETPAGVFDYRYIRRDLFWGYEPLTRQNQTAFVALPEKALLDYFYFLNGPVTREVVEGLRLQSLEILNEKRLLDFAAKFRKPKIARAAREILDYRKELLAAERAV